MAGARHSNVLLTYLRPQARRVMLLAGLLLSGIALQIIGPLVLRRFIDSVAGGAETPLAQLFSLAAVFMAAAAITQGVQIASTWLGEQVAWRATNALRRDLAEHVLTLDMSFHTARTPGELIERVDGDTTALASFFSQFVIQILGGLLLMTGILAVLFRENALVGGAMTIFCIAALVVLQATRNLAVAHYTAERQAWSEMAGFLEERMGGLDDIRANGGGDHVMRKMTGLADSLVEKGIAAQWRGILIFMTTNLTFSLGFALALCLGALLYQRGEITIGTVYLLVQFTGMLGDPLIRIGQQLQQLQGASAGLGRIRQLQAINAHIEDGPGADWRPHAPPRLAFENLAFAYDERAPVLRGVTFDLAPGKVLGLLGRTGSGKTTLTRLLFRLYDPTGGRITLDGVDIRQGTLAQLRGRIGLVTQDIQLFEATVRENATLFDPSIPDDRIRAVLEEIGLGPWFARLPQGLDTVLAGTGGVSAGEAQLIAFARVFLTDPGLVVLDEASSRLDPATDRLIERAMDKLLLPDESGESRTAIIIAHKLATVRRADEILILDRGEVAEAGDRARLAADPTSRFAQLLRSGIEEVLS
ncbi:MAG: ABC transporter ATP-binding protein [Caulobacteraceae bacterium]